MTLTEIEQLIRREIAAARAEGWKIRGHIWRVSVRDQPGLCCALGAVIRNDEPVADEWIASRIIRRLGVSLSWIGAFAEGFDGAPQREDEDYEADAYVLGAKLRAEFVEGA